MTAQESVKRLEIAAVDNSEDETCRTFVMHNEDHTLGNALRYIIMKNPEVEFCGYSIPHPSENKINFRIQTKGASATEVLRKGFTDLLKLCEHTQKTFDESVAKYKETHEQTMETDS